jgi:ribosome-interacting GTPase 1
LNAEPGFWQAGAKRDATAMPANLTPDYHRAEQRLREARTSDEKIEALEEMLRVMPKHKGTDHLQADIRARIAKLKKEPGKKGARGFSYIIPREGAGQVAIVGPPNTGKSSLVGALTHATPEVGDYPFTTREPVPGMMPFEDIAFQLVDLPPISDQHIEAWVFDLIRHADLVWVVLNAADGLEGLDEVQRLLQPRHIELCPVGRQRDPSQVTNLCRDALLVLNAIDRPGAAESVGVVDELLERRWPLLPVSAVTGAGFDLLKHRTFEAFDIIRVRTKQPGKPPDTGAPFTLPRGSTVGDLATRIHKDLVSTMKFARVWGKSVFDGQAVQKDHVLAEGDVVEIH